MKRIAIVQSNYIPWKGYFDLIASVDEFIVYDCVQYTKNDWRNRNQIKTAHGKTWLTVPVQHQSLGQAIDEVEVANPNCFRKHWMTFRQSYAKAPHIRFCVDQLEPLFMEDSPPHLLSTVNVRLIRAVNALLGIRTPLRDAREFDLTGDRNDRLLSLCRQAGATHYLSGPAANSYIDEQQFAEAGVALEWVSYEGYPEYEQPHPPFDHRVSILDLLACAGPAAPQFMLHARGKPQ